jgi:ribonuclease P protein component
MPDERLRREYRIRSRLDFRQVYLQRCRVADDLVVVSGRATDLPFARLGLAVPRSFGTAVVRNRWKRLIREAFRLTRTRMPAGVDLVVSPRRGADPDLAALRASLPKLAAQLSRKLKRTSR